MRTKYYESLDGFIYRQRTTGTPQFWYDRANPQWIMSMAFSHINIDQDKNWKRITRDEARKLFPKAFRKGT